MIKVVKVNVGEIKLYSDDHNLVSRENIPISRHRALSYAANPRADSSDIVLYLAFKDDKMVGYRTVLPDTICIKNQSIKVGWLSGNWVLPEYRRTGISSLLLKEALIDWNNKLLYTNYAPESKAVYDKSEEFELIFKLKGIRLYLKSSLSKILPTRNSFFKSIRFILLFIDNIFNLVNPVPIIGRVVMKNLKVEYEYFHRPDNEISDIFETICRDTPTKRSRFELQWILRFPWLVSSPLGDRIGVKYFFSSSPRKFSQIMVKVFQNDNLVGFMILNQHGDKLSVPYIYYSPKYLRVVARVVLNHALRMKSSTLTIYNIGIAKAIKRVKPIGWFSKVQYRTYFATKDLAKDFKETTVYFNDGDGDCAFI